MEYRVIHSKRRSIGLEIGLQGLLVRAPIGISDAEIEKFLQKHKGWIDAHTKKAEEQRRQLENLSPLTEEEIRALASEALKIIPQRVRYYAPKVGVSYGRITIRNQKTRWGSCSSKGNLNFNCLLMLTPPEVIDSVVVHELCHRKEMNHSQKFYREVLRVYPDYWKWDKWLKDHGSVLMGRMIK